MEKSTFVDVGRDHCCRYTTDFRLEYRPISSAGICGLMVLHPFRRGGCFSRFSLLFCLMVSVKSRIQMARLNWSSDRLLSAQKRSFAGYETQFCRCAQRGLHCTFESFFYYQVPGLGLAISRSIVERLTADIPGPVQIPTRALQFISHSRPAANPPPECCYANPSTTAPEQRGDSAGGLDSQACWWISTKGADQHRPGRSVRSGYGGTCALKRTVPIGTIALLQNPFEAQPLFRALHCALSRRH